MAKATGLGQGVNVLFGNDADEERFFECSVEWIVPNEHQPRMTFNEHDLKELADSIRENGVIQPLIVSRLSSNKYGLIAGERRLRASKLAGLSTVPVVVQDIDSEDTMLELALIENIQRTDLNPLEEAEAYKKLIDRFGYTQEQAAQKVGKKRSTITNALRLLALPEYIKQDLLSDVLSEGHARSLLRLTDDPSTLKIVRDQILEKRLSVRQTESLIRRLRQSSPAKNPAPPKTVDSAEVPKSYHKALENQLTNHLNSRVAIHQNGTRGRIEIEYYSIDDLERLVGLFMNGNSSPS